MILGVTGFLLRAGNLCPIKLPSRHSQTGQYGHEQQYYPHPAQPLGKGPPEEQSHDRIIRAASYPEKGGVAGQPYQLVLHFRHQAIVGQGLVYRPVAKLISLGENGRSGGGQGGHGLEEAIDHAHSQEEIGKRSEEGDAYPAQCHQSKSLFQARLFL